MKLQEKIRDLLITRNLHMRKNAVMLIDNADGTTSEVDLTELAALDNISADDLAKIEGITNGTQAAGKAVVANADVNTGVSKVTELHIGATGSETQVTATADELNIMSGVTATSDEINANNDASANIETLTTTELVNTAETGKHFIINSTTPFVTTLPAANIIGLEYWFHIGPQIPSGGDHTVVTDSGDNVMEGSLYSPEAAAVTCVAAADAVVFVDALTVQGDLLHIWCDGSSWLIDGHCFVQDGMLTSQA